MNLNTLKEYRQEVYGCFGQAKDALFNTVDALLTEDRARSFPELSLSPHFERRWPSLYEGLEDGKIDQKRLQKVFARFLLQGHAQELVWVGIDVSGIARPRARTSADRSALYVHNLPECKKPITFGWQFSTAVVLPLTPSSWTYVLDQQRVSTQTTAAFTASDVLDLYLHRGSFETHLSDEDEEQNADRWYSHTPCGQEFAQIIGQCVWNLRLELGQQLSQAELRTTEFAPVQTAEPAVKEKPTPEDSSASSVIYGPPQWARPSFTHGFPGSAFTPKPDGTLRCPANHPLYLQERRPERDGSLRLLYAARMGHCRSCPLRVQCQERSTTLKPRRVSAVLWPIDSSPPTCSSMCSDGPPLPLAPVLWRDWPRCSIRRTWLKVVRSQTISVESPSPFSPLRTTESTEKRFTRAERTHWRLSWDQRLARNARPADAPRLVVTLHGLPATFASSFGFDLLATA